MSAAKAGAISSGYQIGYAISLLVISSLADRIGARFLFLTSMLTGAVFTMAFAFFARGYLSALILYTLAALAIGGSYTTGLMLLTEHYPPHRRGLATGFYIASSSLAYVLSLSLSGLTMPDRRVQAFFLRDRVLRRSWGLSCRGSLWPKRERSLWTGRGSRALEKKCFPTNRPCSTWEPTPSIAGSFLACGPGHRPS